MGRLKDFDSIQTIGAGSTPAETASSYDSAPTPVDNNQLYDYAMQAQPAADNPYATAGATTDTSSFDTTPTQEQAPQETTPQQPQTTAEMTQAAVEANSNTQQALQDTLTAWGNQNNISTSRMTEMQQFQSLTPEQKQIVLAYEQKNNPDNYNSFLSDRNRYNQYASSLTTPATPAATPAPTQAPAQETAPQQNPILPSAGGNYQADSIYDPSKTYGRQPDGSYVYSSSAAQLQRDLNRTMNAGLTVDGYFGEKTQQALNAYLSQYGKPNGSASAAGAGQMYDAPIGPTPPQPGSSATTLPANTTTAPGTATSAALAASAAEAPTTPTTPSAPSTSKSGHDDAWYAEQYEKITGSAPRTDILSPERIRDFVDKEMAKTPVTPEDEGYDAMLQQQALYEQAQEQQRLNEMNERRYEAFEPILQQKLNSGMTIDQIVGEGDKSFNRWLQDNWDDLSYTYRDLGSEYPTVGTLPDNTPEKTPEEYHNDAINELNAEYDRVTGNSVSEQLADINARGRSMDAYYRNMLDNAQAEQPSGYSMNTPSAPTGNGAYADANREEVRSPEGRASWTNAWTQTPEYRELERNRQLQAIEDRGRLMTDYYSKMLDDMQSQPEAMASDDIQSSSTTTETATSEEQNMRDAYEAAMQSAGRARDIFQGLPTEAEQMQQAREQREQNMRTALENQFNNPYMQQFQRDFELLKQQFPNYSDTALMDMVLVNEEMRNGQSSYYKWLANSL